MRVELHREKTYFFVSGKHKPETMTQRQLRLFLDSMRDTKHRKRQRENNTTTEGKIKAESMRVGESSH